MTAADLIAFEAEIADLFRERAIRAPVHLQSNCEQQLIDIFRQHVGPDDWVLCGWRSHLHCLLKGVPREQVRQAILDGRSIALCFPEYRVLSSAIVGGTAPIAVGLAMGIKRKGEARKAVAFLGDMTAETGIVHESVKYAANHDLPVLWVVEDNGFSVRTNTREAWGRPGGLRGGNVIGYRYTNGFPHVGLSEWVSF